MGMVIRRLDNRPLDHFVNGIRCLHGNRVLHKDDFARGLLTAMRARRYGRHPHGHQHDSAAGRVCALLRPYGLHCCRPGARRAEDGAAVLPGFMLWEPAEGRYVLHFGPELHFEKTGDHEADILAATQQCNDVLESWIRRYPDQWLWIHRRWKTRPPGEPALYYQCTRMQIKTAWPEKGDASMTLSELIEQLGGTWCKATRTW